MKVCGFTFIRNAVKYDFPVVEAIKSVLPVCDKMIVAVGKSDDDTLGLINAIGDPRVEIIETIWDDTLRQGGQVLAVETNKAFDAIPSEYDWCFYIQGDEVIHEQYLENIKMAMEQNLNNTNVEGLLFKYRHFYGTYSYVADSRTWYRNEIRIVRNNKQIRSYKDAQGFRKNNLKLNVIPIDAFVNHYGWVRPPHVMKEKVVHTSNFWNNDNNVVEKLNSAEVFDYSLVDSITRFEGSHPQVMLERIKQLQWTANLDPGKKRFKLKDWLLYKFEKLTGYRLWEYRNYKMIFA
jgi:hypothetical protein